MQQNNQPQWGQWAQNFDWIMGVARKKRWSLDELFIEPPVDKKVVESIEKEIGQKFPSDFKEVLTNYASAVYLKWQVMRRKLGGYYKPITSGGGRGYLWDIELLISLNIRYHSWLQKVFSDTSNPYNQIWHNKTPFINVPNGDMIAFTQADTKGNQAVIYLSHDGDQFHGSILADSFTEFITLWSNIGCVGTECWQFEPFYDSQNKKIKAEGKEVSEWKKLLNA